MGTRVKLIFAAAAAIFLSGSADAFSYIEGTDLPGSSGFGAGSVSVGAVSTGLNSVSGKLSASCIPAMSAYDCNSSFILDGQDSFLFTVADGLAITGISLSSSTELPLPAGFGYALNIRSTSADLLRQSFLNVGTSYTFAGPIGPGTYSASVYGQSASGSGTYSLSYLLGLTATASAVPEPATWAMMFIGVGLVGLSIRRARRLTKKGDASLA